MSCVCESFGVPFQNWIIYRSLHNCCLCFRSTPTNMLFCLLQTHTHTHTHTQGCVGFVWDTIPGELAGQCHGKAPQGCCLMKSTISSVTPKNGDSCYIMPSPGRPPIPSGVCELHSGAPAVEQYHPPADNATMSDHRVASGVRGVWSASADRRTLVHERTNPYTPSPADPASAVGDFAMTAVGDGTTSTVATGETLQSLWADFADDGSLRAETSGGVDAAAGYGGVTVSIEVPAGGTATASIVFAWRLPNRLCTIQSTLFLMGVLVSLCTLLFSYHSDPCSCLYPTHTQYVHACTCTLCLSLRLCIDCTE